MSEREELEDPSISSGLKQGRLHDSGSDLDTESLMSPVPDIHASPLTTVIRVKAEYAPKT